MRTLAVVVAIAAFIAAGCGGASPAAPVGPSASSLSGTWVGSASDSSSPMMGAGGMMGQGGMGDMTWQVSQSGNTVTATMTFAGLSGHMPGSMTGTMSGDTLTFTMTMPAGSMMSASCSATGTGTMQVNGTMMTGTYSGSDSCTGAFGNGHMSMTKR